MKKFLLSFMAVMMSVVSMYAGEVTFDWSTATTQAQTSAYVLKSGDVTITFDKGTGSNVPSPNKAGHVRMYAGTTLNITTSNGTIAKVVFNSVSDSYSAATNLTYNGTVIGTDAWDCSSYESSDITLTATANARFVSITVTTAVKAAGLDTDITKLAGKQILSASTTAADSLIATNQWYLLKQSRYGYTPAYDAGEGVTIMRAASDVAIAAGDSATNVAQYLVRFIPTANEGAYNILFGTGRYIGADLKASATAGEYNVYMIGGTPGHFGINKYDKAEIVDNNGAGYDLSFWDSGEVINTGGNNDWSIYPVTLVTTQDQYNEMLLAIAQAERNAALKALVDSVNTVYAANADKNAIYDGAASTLAAAIKTASDIENATEKDIATLQAAADAYNYAITAETMTLAEVRAAADNTNVKTTGTVTYVNGRNVYLQDATSADLFYFTTAPEVNVGDVITVTGTTTTYVGAPEVKNAALLNSATGTPVVAKTYSLAELMADGGLSHFGELVNVYNVTVDSWKTGSGYTDPYVTDGTNKALCYFTADSTVYAFQTPVKLTSVVAAYHDAFQFAGSTENLAKYYEYPTTVLAGETNLADWTRTFANETSADGSFELNTWSTEADESGIAVPFIQSWVWGGAGAQLSAMTIAHNQITGLTNGSYKVNLLVRAFNEQAGSSTPSGITFTANGKTTDFSTIGTVSSYNNMAELYGNIEVPAEVTDGTLDFSINIANPGLSWLAFKNFGLTYIAVEAPVVTPIVGKMNAGVAAAQEATVAAYKAEPTSDNYNAAVAAVAAAEVSADYYAGIASKLNTLDEDGQAAFAATEKGAGYADGTLVDEDCTEELVAAAKAQTTNGADMTLAMPSTWTCKQGNGPGKYVDATETYNTSAYVAGKVMYQRIEGLAPGTYTVQFYATANMAWIGAETGSGIAQIYANDVTEDIDVIGQTACTPTDYLRSITFTVGEDSVAEYGLQNIAQGGNWYLAQAISLTFDKAASKLLGTYYAYNNASATAPIYADAGAYYQSILGGEFAATFEEYNDKVVIKGFDGVEGNDLTLEWDDNGWSLINGEAAPWIYTTDDNYYGAYVYATGGYTYGEWVATPGYFAIGGWFYKDENDAGTWGYINYTITDGAVFEYSADSYVGSYYEGKAVDVDLDAILASVGAASVSDVTIYSVNAGTQTEGVRGTTDGWRNAEGAFQTWGDNAVYYLQDNTDLPGAEYWLGGMPGNTDSEASYTTQLIYKNNTTGAQANVYITFNYIPVPDVSALTVTDLGIEASVEYDYTDASYTEKIVTLSDEQVQQIETELGIDDLSSAYYCGYNPSTQTLLAGYSNYDGWRNPETGDFTSWTGTTDVPFCVKYDDGQNYYCYNIQNGWQTGACYWAICNSEKAVLVKINFSYANVPDAINGISANEKATIYNLNGVKLNKMQRGINIINGKKVILK